MKNTKFVALSAVAVLGVALLGGSSVFAAQTVGTVTGKDGDVKDKVALTAAITSVAGSHVTFKDTDTGTEYTSSFGPNRNSYSYTVGDNVAVVGVETESANNNNAHNFQVMEVDGNVIRENFEGKPTWAGTQGQGNGSGAGMNQGSGGMNRGSNKGTSFVDANGDGVCDNSAN